jgi:hypothetical protein
MKFNVFLFCLFFIYVIVTFSDNEQVPQLYKVDAQEQAKIEQIHALMADEKYDLALPLINTRLNTQLAKQPIDKPILAWLYDMKAHVMASRYHFHYAIEAITQAEQHKSNQRYRELKAQWIKQIDSMQNERLDETNYVSGRYAGLSQSLTKKIHIAYIYIDDNRNSKWSGKLRLKNQVSVDKVLSWYIQQASRYNIDDLAFKVRYFVVNSPRGVGKQWLRDPTAFNQILTSLLKQLQHRNTGEFIKDIAGRHRQVHLQRCRFHSRD